MKKLNRGFYTRENVVQISRELLGKTLVTKIDGRVTSGIITETEAYAGVTDRASHAYNGKRTLRTEVMYQVGGIAYVYLCYGMHYLFNVVTNIKNIPHAVLIRAIVPEKGVKFILERRNALNNYKKLTCGPGKVSQALGIKSIHTGCNLCGNEIWIEDCGISVNEKNIITGTRIGVGYAGKDAELPYRFTVNDICLLL